MELLLIGTVHSIFICISQGILPKYFMYVFSKISISFRMLYVETWLLYFENILTQLFVQYTGTQYSLEIFFHKNPTLKNIELMEERSSLLLYFSVRPRLLNIICHASQLNFPFQSQIQLFFYVYCWEYNNYYQIMYFCSVEIEEKKSLKNEWIFTVLGALHGREIGLRGHNFRYR